MATVNAITQSEFDAAASVEAVAAPSESLGRAQLYHFFELALAHPGEDGFDYFRQEPTEQAFLKAWSSLSSGNKERLDQGLAAAGIFFSMLRERSYEEVEAAHINLFSSNFPHLPCPPYGSLFTANDADKRLEEMLAIKDCYHRNGVDIDDSFTDLPDHLCVELEFTQLLCFREHEALARADTDVQAGIRGAQAEFLDRFLLPLGNSLADLAVAAMPENPYRHLLEALRCFLLEHRQNLEAISDSSQ
jgi:putative dimethyl sulfoxide reductase chaperone